MNVIIFDNIRSLNEYLTNKKKDKTEVQHTAYIVGQSLDKDGRKIFEIVDRFMVIE